MNPFDHLRPGSRPERAGLRALMLGQAARPGVARTALGGALRAAALGRLDPAERDWSGRIRERRARLAGGGAADYLSPSAGDRNEAADDVAAYLASSAEPWSLPEIWGEFLLRLVRGLEPRSCLELGTGFGVSGLYVAAALRLNGGGRLISIDREERLRPVAERGFSDLGLAGRVELVTGEVGAAIERALAAAGPVDWALIDAEHTEDATVAHFQALLPGLAPAAVVVVDDINLSAQMRRAWGRISAHPSVSLALGLRRLGVVVTARAA